MHEVFIFFLHSRSFSCFILFLCFMVPISTSWIKSFKNFKFSVKVPVVSCCAAFHCWQFELSAYYLLSSADHHRFCFQQSFVDVTLPYLPSLLLLPCVAVDYPAALAQQNDWFSMVSCFQCKILAGDSKWFNALTNMARGMRAPQIAKSW